MIKISVIVPAYNAEKTLGRCIDSIIAQTYSDFEVIIINDGSKDNTASIAESYVKKDNRIRLINKPNGGISSVRNLGIKEAKGEYINFVDSDDYIDEDTYEICVTAMKEYGVDAVIYGYYYEQGKRLVAFNYDKQKTVYTSREVIEKISRGQDISTFLPNKLWKKSLFEGIVFPEGQIYEDADRIYYIVNNGRKYLKLDSAKYHWIQNPSSITHEAFSKRKLDEIKALDSAISFFDEGDELKTIEQKHKLKKYEQIIDDMNVLGLEKDALYLNVTNNFKKYCDEVKGILDDKDKMYYQNPGFNKKRAIREARVGALKNKMKKLILKTE